jgi:ankyrin repeat protein
MSWVCVRAANTEVVLRLGLLLTIAMGAFFSQPVNASANDASKHLRVEEHLKLDDGASEKTATTYGKLTDEVVPTFDKKILATLIPQICWTEKRVLNPEELARVEFLLKEGALVDEPNHGSTPLMFAAQRGDLPLVKLLLNRGANAALRGGAGTTVLQFAVQANNMGLFAEVYNRAPDAKILSTLVRWISGNQKRVATPEELAMIEGLLKAGVVVDEPEASFGSTPLMFAAQRGDLPLVKLLLKHGAKASLLSNAGTSVLDFAMQANSAELVAEVYGKAPNPKILATIIPSINGVQRRALNTAELANVEALLTSGAFVDEPDPTWGSTPLMFAAQRGDLPLVKLLLKHGANASLLSNAGTSVLEFAMQANSAELVAEVYGKAPNPKNLATIIPSINGVQKRALNAAELANVEALLTSGAFVDEPDPTWGSTPLMFAAQRGDLPLLRLLLKYNANPLIVNPRTQKTAFSYIENQAEVSPVLLELSKAVAWATMFQAAKGTGSGAAASGTSAP